MTELQNKLLEILTWFIKFLDDNGITYYAVGGTLLGAVRHKGFIPWDDDIDIAIPRHDYDKLIKLFNKKREHYVLETPYDNNKDYLYTYSKLYDTRTTLVERQRKSLKRGVFIDIFPLDGAGNSYEEALSFHKKINKRNILLIAKTCAIRKQRKWYKNLLILIARLFPFYNLKKLSLKVDKSFSEKDYDSNLYISNFNGSYGSKEINEKRVFGTPKEYTFENIKIKGPEYHNEYLTRIYGDWRELPPPEKRGVQHSFLMIDLKTPYLDE